MSPDDLIGELEARLEEVRAELERAERGELPPEVARDGIVFLFRDVDGLIRRLSEVREEIRPLVERYQTLRTSPPPPDPEESAESVRSDRLGASTFLERGWNAIASAEYEEAVRATRRALELDPHSSRGEVLLGWALMRLGRLDEAEAALRGLLRREPEHALARTGAGYIALRRGRLDRAEEILAAILAGSPDRTSAIYANLYLGMVYAEREASTEALERFEQAIRLGPALAEAYWELGRAHYRAGDRERAVESWGRGAQANRFNFWGERCKDAAVQAQAGEPVSLD